MAADAIQDGAPLAPDEPMRTIITPSPEPDRVYESSDDEDEEGPHEGFAMLRFEDSCYVMTSLELLIGRDLVAGRVAHYLNEQLEAVQVIQQGDTLIYEAPRQDQTAMEGIETTGQESQNQVNLAEDQPKVAEVAVAEVAVADADMPPIDVLGSDLGILSIIPDEVIKPKPDDPQATDECPILCIHQPKPEGQLFPSESSISRKHAKIHYDPDECQFMIDVLSRNGIWINDGFETRGYSVPLPHGSRVMIGMTEFVFELPNGGEETRIGYGFQNSQGDDIGTLYSSEDQFGSELDIPMDTIIYDDEIEYSSGGSGSDMGPSSSDDSSGSEDDDEALDTENPDQDTTERGANGTNKLKLNFSRDGSGAKGQSHKVGHKSTKKLGKSTMRPVLSSKSKPSKTTSQQNGNKHPRDGDATGKSKSAEKLEKKEGSPTEADIAQVSRDSEIINGEGVFIEGLPMGAKIPPKKKGPGRPPKNGFLSKRELNQMSKAHKEAEKNGITDPNAAYFMMEAKKAEKASKAAKGDGPAGDGEDGDKDGNEVKKKIPRTARSPSPEMKQSDYTEEQLQRPPDNYVVLIYEALVNHPQKKMNLQQIYSSIERRYPFFKFKTGTSGWQSSVRHNLGQNSTFEKVEKDGKGWMWGVVPGVTLESIREKKKKATPPPMPPPSTHHGAGSSGYQYGAPHSHSYPHAPGQSNPVATHGYSHGPSIPPRPTIPQPGGNQSTSNNTINGLPNITQPGIVRPNTNMYAPQYPPGSQRPQVPAPHHPANYGQPSTSRPPASNYGHNQPLAGASHPPNRSMSTTPNLPPQQRRNPMPRPSPDVIDTFISVFTSSFRDFKEGQEITAAKANFIVRNAVARVLEPDSVANVPEDPSEKAIISAFRKCLEQSQPRLDAGVAPRTYSNYLYPYAARTQSAVFSNVSHNSPGSSPGPSTTNAGRGYASSPSTTGIMPATAGPHHNNNNHPPPPHPGRPSNLGTPIATTGHVNASAVLSAPPTSISISLIPPGVSSQAGKPKTAENLAIEAATAVASATTSSTSRPTPLDLSSNRGSRSSASSSNTPATISASLASSVKQMLSNATPGTASPRAPAIEPITPPAAPSSGKRPIDDVEDTEKRATEKKPAV
jgi:hypothetical protein